MLNQLQGVFASFHKHEVKYVIIGGIAAILYGVPRATFDLDILIDPTPKNAQKLLDAMVEAGLGTAVLTSVDELLTHEITIFRDRVRIDVQTFTPGITFADAWEHREVMQYGGQEFYVVSRDHLISSKQAAGRPQDLQDVSLLILEQDEEE